MSCSDQFICNRDNLCLCQIYEPPPSWIEMLHNLVRWIIFIYFLLCVLILLIRTSPTGTSPHTPLDDRVHAPFLPRCSIHLFSLTKAAQALDGSISRCFRFGMSGIRQTYPTCKHPLTVRRHGWCSWGLKCAPKKHRLCNAKHSFACGERWFASLGTARSALSRRPDRGDGFNCT